MEKHLYITEPEHLDIGRARDLLTPEGWSVTEGTIDFAKCKAQNYSTLMIRSETQVDKNILNYFPHLKSIIRIGTGLDNIDLEYCKQAGIAVYNAAGANAGAVAEYIVTMALYVLRKISTLTTEDVAAWNRFKFRGESLREQKVGLIGFGHIGWALYRYLEAAGCKEISIYDPYVDPVTLPNDIELASTIEELLADCSLISIQVPLTSTTKDLVGVEELGSLKDGAVLVNVSHGGVVDELAVIGALNERSQFTYVADTVSNEPHPNATLMNHENVIITPHVASLTGAAESAMLEHAVANFLNQTTAV